MFHVKHSPKRHSRRRANRQLTIQAAVILSLVLTISVYFTVLAAAQRTYTITDGDSVTVHTSTATDVAQVLSEAGIDVGADDLVTTSGSGNSTEVHIQRSRSVTVTYLGQESAANTYSTTVQDLMGELNIPLSTDDVITAHGQVLSADEPLYDGMNLHIRSNSQKTFTETVSIPHETVTYLDPTLEVGNTVVKTQGADGQQEITYLSEYVDGQLSATTVVGTKLLSPAVDEVVLQGSKTPAPTEEETAVEIYTEPEPQETLQPSASSPTVTMSSSGSYDDEEDYDEEDADDYDDEEDYDEESYSDDSDDADEDSSDYEDYDDYDEEDEANYDAPSGDTITTSSGEVLSYVDCLTVEATAYTGGGTTATGTPARYGAIAVDPKVIPYGTKMYIVSEDGNWIYGEATAEDCGGAIKGNIIDLYFDSYNTCIQFGRRNCTVYILEWG